MAIYEINGARYDIDDTNLNQQQLEAAIDDIAAQPRDSALDYSFDVAAQMGYKGTEAFGSALQGIGLDTVGSAVQGFGARGVAQQEEDIARGNYQAQYTGSLLEQDSIGDAAGWLLEGMQANAASSGFALAGTAAAAVAGLVSAPAALLLGGATLSGSFLMGTGESALEQEEKTGSYDSSVALGTGAIIGLLDRFGAGRVFSPSELGKMSVKELYEKLAKKGYTEAAQDVAKEIGKKAAAEGITEATQEAAVIGSAASQGGQYTAGEVGNRLVDAAALGTGFGGTAATAQTAVQGAAQAAGFAKSSTQRQADNVNGAAAALLDRGMETGDQALIDKANEIGFAVEAAKNGDTEPLQKLAIEEEAALDPTELAKASFAHRLNEIVEDGPAGGGQFDVNELNVESPNGARSLIEAAHGSIKGRIQELKGILKEGGTLSDGTQYSGLNPKNANTFDEVMERVEAMVGVTMAKNKVKKSITNSQIEKVIELVGDTQEGKELINLIRESLVMTDVHNQGYVGGLSQFTEKLNPLAPTGSYNTSANVQAAVRTALTAAGAAGTGGVSLLAQAGVVGFGRFYDSLTGERSSVGKFIADNETGNRLPQPGPPSIIEDQAAAQQRQEQVSAAMQPLLNQGKKPSGGPVAKVIERAQEQLVGIEVTQDDYDAALDYRIATATTPLQKEVFQDIKERKYRDQMPEDAMAVLTETIVKNKAGEAQAVQTRLRESQEAMIAMDQRNQRNQRIEQGKADNRAAVNQLLDQLSSDNVINKGHKAQLQSALAGTFLRDLGRNPMATVENTVKDLQDNGVPQEAIDTYIMPYAQRVAGQQDARPQEFTEESSVLDPLDLGDEIDATILDIYPDDDNAQAPYKAKSLRDAAEWLFDNLYVPHYGTREPLAYTPENKEKIARKMAAEALRALESDNNAIGWYDRTLRRAKAVLGLIEPLAVQSNNPDTLAAFNVALAVTSNGTAVTDNFEYAVEAFRFYTENDKFPVKEWNKGGERRRSMRDAFAFFNAYQKARDTGKFDMPIGEFLDKQFTVKELEVFIASFNDRYNTNIKVPSSEGKAVLVNGSYIMGPKIGQGFYQNLTGNFDPLTTDIWWMRMWNRMVGRPFATPMTDAKMQENRDKIASEMKAAKGDNKQVINEALKATGETRKGLYSDPDRFDAFIGALDKAWQRYYKKYQKENGRNPEKPQLFKSTGTHVKNMGPQLQEQPKNTSERVFIRDTVNRVKELLSQQGIDIETADFQALMWYPEKRLFRSLGVKGGRGEDNDYLDAARILAEKEGISNDRIEEALAAAERGPDGNNPGPGSGQQTGRLDSGSGRLSQFTEFSQQPELPGILSERDNSAQPAQPVQEEVVVPSVRQVAAQEENAKPIFEVGKSGSPFENGIKKRADLERLAKALGIVFGTVKSMAAMDRESGAISKPGTTTMGRAHISRYGRKPPSILLMEPGFPKRSKNTEKPVQSKDGFVATLAHEIAHFLEALPLFNRRDNTPEGALSLYDPYLQRSPLTLNEDYVQPTSFRQVLLDSVRYAKNDNKVTPELVRLGVSREDANLILEEITNLQDFGNINIDIGNGTLVPSFVRGPFGADPEAFADGSLKKFEKFKQEQIEAGASTAGFISSGRYRVSAIQAMTKHRNNYMRNPAEFAVDPIWVYMVDPKFAKETMPTTAEFIRKLLNNAAFSKDTLQFYSSPIATMVAAALAILAANGGEEPEEQPLPPGALSPQGQGALSVI
jgi:hypothetical protein